jgi:hypothetical protein
MLFDAALSRALGQKFARQDVEPTSPNSAKSTVFFSKFPVLADYLLTHLTSDVHLVETKQVAPHLPTSDSGRRQLGTLPHFDVTFAVRCPPSGSESK